MNADVFIDTNIFLYAISDQTDEQEKAQRARELLLTQRWGWSVQVAGEFFVTATSPRRPFQLSSKRAAEFVRTWLEFPTAIRWSINSIARFGNTAAVSTELLGCCDHC